MAIKRLLAAVLGLLVVASALPAQTTAGPSTPAPAGEAAAAASSFHISVDPSVLPEPYSGRLYVALQRDGRGEPRRAMGNWFGGPWVVVADVKGLAPGASASVGAGAMGFPGTLAEIEPGEWLVQAVARRSPDSSKPGRGEGDLYSLPVRVRVEAGGAAGAFELRLTEVVQPSPFHETERVKYFEVVSPRLSEFHGREMKMRAAVILPPGWSEETQERWPVVYFITGFGGDHTSAASIAKRLGTGSEGAECLVVVPDPGWYRGHTVFADSENNGPWGAALIRDLIPALESKFHGAGEGTRRYVTGVSSGGWSSLWLQTAYPEEFNGCWAHVPDPVDLRDFQRINLYEPGANMYRDAQGNRRPLARRGAEDVILWYDDFVRQEAVMGPGGQIHAFEAVFSPRGPDGEPAALFDRATGAIDPTTAEAWKPYDIRLVMEERWAELGPKLAGKIHVYAGEHDSFYLEGAARLLKESLERLRSDAVVEIVPGMPHTIHEPGVRAMWERIRSNAGR